MNDKDVIIGQLVAENQQLRNEIQLLREEIDRLKKNSGNSSKPPSSDIVKPPKPKGRGKKKRQRGGQKGHKKFERPAIRMMANCIGAGVSRTANTVCFISIRRAVAKCLKRYWGNLKVGTKGVRELKAGIKGVRELKGELKVSGTFSLTSVLYSCGCKSKNRLLRIRRMVFRLLLSFRHLTFLRRRRKADYGEKQGLRLVRRRIQNHAQSASEKSVVSCEAEKREATEFTEVSEKYGYYLR